jgi:hypothetical protein
MDLKDLPPVSDFIALTYNPAEIANKLRLLMQAHSFEHMDIVRGTDRSIRILLTKPTTTSVRLTHRFSSDDVAEALEKLKPEARYGPPVTSNHLGVMMKGWEIRRLIIDDSPAILIWTAWA